MKDRDWILTSGVHTGKAIRELTDRELRCVWAGQNGGKRSKHKPVFRVLTRELHRREGTICPPWAIDQGDQGEPSDATGLANWLRDNAPQLCIEYDSGGWAVSSLVFVGWATGPDFETTLRKARDMVLAARKQAMPVCA